MATRESGNLFSYLVVAWLLFAGSAFLPTVLNQFVGLRFLLLVSGLVILFGYLFAVNKRPKLIITRPLLICLSFFVLSLLSGFFSKVPLMSIFEVSNAGASVLMLVALGAVFLLTAAEIIKKREFKVFLLLINTIFVVYALFQGLGVDMFAAFWEPSAFLGRVFSLSGHPNWLAALLLLTVPSWFYVAGYSQWRVMSGLMILTNLLVLGLTASKAGLLALLFLAAVYVLREKKRLWLAFGAAALVLVLLVPFFLQRTNLEAVDNRSVGNRVELWQAGLGSLELLPLGHGLQTTKLLSNYNIDSDLWLYEDPKVRIASYHSQPLDLAVERGVLTMLLFYVGAIWLIFVGLKAKDRFVSSIALGLLAYLILNLVSNLQFTNELIFWLGLGYLAAQSKLDNYRKSIQLGRPLWVALLLLFAVITLLQLQSLRADFARTQARALADTDLLVVAEQKLVAAHNLYPYSEPGVREQLRFYFEIDNSGSLKPVLDWYAAYTAGLSPDIAVYDTWWRLQEFGYSPDIGLAIIKNRARLENLFTLVVILDNFALESEGKEALAFLLRGLPVYWDAESSEPGRILRKNNPWLNQLKPID